MRKVKKSEQKTEQLLIKMTKEMKDKVFFQATARALDMSAYVRMLIAENLGAKKRLGQPRRTDPA